MKNSPALSLSDVEIEQAGTLLRDFLRTFERSIPHPLCFAGTRPSRVVRTPDGPVSREWSWNQANVPANFREGLTELDSDCSSALPCLCQAKPLKPLLVVSC